MTSYLNGTPYDGEELSKNNADLREVIQDIRKIDFDTALNIFIDNLDVLKKSISHIVKVRIMDDVMLDSFQTDLMCMNECVKRMHELKKLL